MTKQGGELLSAGCWLLDMYVWVNPSFVDVRIRGCASVFHAGHVGNVLRPSIAFRQWLGSEYPQITTAGRNARAARPGPLQPCFRALLKS